MRSNKIKVIFISMIVLAIVIVLFVFISNFMFKNNTSYGVTIVGERLV